MAANKVIPTKATTIEIADAVRTALINKTWPPDWKGVHVVPDPKT
jgi:hypothetical protein